MLTKGIIFSIFSHSANRYFNKKRVYFFEFNLPRPQPAALYTINNASFARYIYNMLSMCLVSREKNQEIILDEF